MSNGQHDDQPGAHIAPNQQAYALGRADDLQFLQAWERGLVPLVGAAVRVRQIRRILATPPQASSQVQ